MVIELERINNIKKYFTKNKNILFSNSAMYIIDDQWRDEVI